MNIFSFLKKRTPRTELPPERKLFRFTLWAFFGMFALLSLSALVAFLLSLRGPEETVVPDLTRRELVDALVQLQERGLYPMVQLRYYSDPTLKGQVVTQNPAPGSVVRVGRRINLNVSQGSIIEDVEDYRGMSLQEVQAEVQALGSGSTRILFMGTVSNVFDDAPPGTVIAQNPPAGTRLSGSTALDLVVSRGPDIETISLPTYLGLDWEEAVQVLSRDNVPFVFRLEADRTPGRSGVVVGQSPDAGQEVNVGTPVQLVVREELNPPGGYRFGIFDRTLPTYSVSVELSAVAVNPDGETSTLFSMNHPGGRVAFPYELETGSMIILYRFDTEVIRYPVLEQLPQNADQ